MIDQSARIVFGYIKQAARARLFALVGVIVTGQGSAFAQKDQETPGKQTYAKEYFEPFRGTKVVQGVEISPPKRDYAQEYFEPFKGPPANRKDFALLGPNADRYVAFEPEGMRINLPTDVPGERLSTGVTSTFGVKGDFEITLGYEILRQPDAEDAGPATRFTLAVALDRPNSKQHQVSHSRRWTKTGEHLFTWFTAPGLIPGKAVQRSDTFRLKTKEKAGQLRLVRSGAEVFFLAAEGNDTEFAVLQKYMFGDEDLREIIIASSTGGPKASLDVRVTGLRVRAEAVPIVLGPPKVIVVPDPDPPRRDYAQEYIQSFKAVAKPALWDRIGPAAENCVHFEAQGLRITLPPGWKGSRGSTGAAAPLIVKGDFEITVAYELLDQKIDEAAAFATRLSLGIFKDTPKSNVATMSRTLASKTGNRFTAWQSLWNDDLDKAVERFAPLDATSKVGRLRMVRSGSDLYFLMSEGNDERFTVVKKFLFGPEDLRDVRVAGSTGGEAAMLDARVTDLRIRAEALPNAPAAAAPGAPAPAPQAPVSEVAQQTVGKGWLAAFLLAGFALTLFFLVAASGFYFLRQRRLANAVATPDKDASARTSMASIASKCSACNKGFKVRAESAGRKVKCPHCGQAVLVIEDRVRGA